VHPFASLQAFSSLANPEHLASPFAAEKMQASSVTKESSLIGSGIKDRKAI
jgi:hypothetical protein